MDWSSNRAKRERKIGGAYHGQCSASTALHAETGPTRLAKAAERGSVATPPILAADEGGRPARRPPERKENQRKTVSPGRGPANDQTQPTHLVYDVWHNINVVSDI